MKHVAQNSDSNYDISTESQGEEESMQKVSVRETRQYISRLLDSVARGEEILITRRGKPVARLIPVSPANTKQVHFPDRAPLRDSIPPARKTSKDLIREIREGRG